MDALSLAQLRTRLDQLAAVADAQELRQLQAELAALTERVQTPIGEIAGWIRELDDIAADLRYIGDSVQVDPSDPALAEAFARTRHLRATLMAAMRALNPEQAWFWTEAWQAGEREVDAEIAATAYGPLFTEDEFDAHLRSLRPDLADFEYGSAARGPGAHIHWRRIGGHEIYDEP